MADYYADATNGNDAWDGLAPAFVSGTNGPRKTFISAMGLVTAAGDSLSFKRGEVFYTAEHAMNVNGTVGSHITLTDYGDATDGLPSIRCFEVLDGTWTDTGESGGGNTVWEYTVAGNIATEQGNLWVDGAGHAGSGGADGLYVTWNTNVATTFNDPTNQGDMWSIDTATENIYFCTDTNPNSDGKLYELIINDGTRDDLVRWFNADYWDLENIDFQGGYNSAHWLAGNSAQTNRMTFTDCTHSRSFGAAIKVSNAATAPFDLTVAQGRFTNQLEQGTHAIQIIGSAENQLKVEFTQFTGVDHGMQIGNASASAYGYVRYCLFKDTKDDGIWFGNGNAPTSGNMDIYYNVVINGGDVGIQANGSGAADRMKNTRLWNNTIALCSEAGITSWAADSTCEVKNNLLYNNRRQDAQTGLNEDYAVEVAASGADVDYNLVWSDQAYRLASYVDNPATPPTVDTTWAAYLTTSSQDANGISASPRLANGVPSEVVHCKLQSQSPARGAGTDNSSVTAGVDYFGNVVDTSAPDIGAIAYIETGGRMTDLEMGSFKPWELGV
jgi:hypothetical protein